MHEKKCKYCSMMIPKDAKICPHCRKKQGGGLLFISFIILVLIIIGVSMNRGQQTNKETSNSDLAFDAYVMCKQKVEERLKAPSTAEFLPHAASDIKRMAGDKRGDMYEVNSYVDAQNSFGAKIRTNFKCSVVHVNKTDGWILASLKTWDNQ
jgi:hypothetical protein